MALRNLLTLKAAWQRKTQLKPPTTLNISHQASAMFAKQSLKLSNVAISSLILQHYDVVQDLIQALIRNRQPNSVAKLDESIRLMAGIIATEIKKLYSSRQRIENENVFLICIEVFREGVGAHIPDEAQKEEAINRIQWDQIHCEDFDIDSGFL
jgi:hypothetical protein